MYVCVWICVCFLQETGPGVPKIDLKHLVAAQLLHVGDVIVCKKKEGTIAADGYINFNGKKMKSVSSFAHSCGVQRTVSGWRTCFFQNESLQEIRDRYARAGSSGQGGGAGSGAAQGGAAANGGGGGGRGRGLRGLASNTIGGSRVVERWCHNKACAVFAKRVRLGPASKVSV